MSLSNGEKKLLAHLLREFSETLSKVMP